MVRLAVRPGESPERAAVDCHALETVGSVEVSREDQGAAWLAWMNCELYRHFGKSGRLLYVGVSLSSVARLAQHRSQSKWFSQIARIEITRFDTRELAEAAEVAAIRDEKPRYNRAGRRPYITSKQVKLVWKRTQMRIAKERSMMGIRMRKLEEEAANALPSCAAKLPPIDVAVSRK